MITDTDKQDPISQRPRRRFVWWAVIALAVGGAWLAWPIARRAHRLVQEARQVRVLTKEINQQQDVLGRTAADKMLSAGFLQMALGDNPPLLEQVTKLVATKQAKTEGNLSLLLVTYRPEGGARDVAIHLIGNRRTVPIGPTTSKLNQLDGSLADQYHSLRQSVHSLAAGDVVVISEPSTQQRHRELLEAVFQNRVGIIEEYLREPLAFVAVLPDPGLFVGEQFRPVFISALVKGRISPTGAQAEFVALSYDARAAKDWAQFLADMQFLGVKLAGRRFDGEVARLALQQAAAARIRTEGTGVQVQVTMPRDAVAIGLPRLVGAVAKMAERNTNEVHSPPR